jgi:hypothetical protein
MTEHDDRLLAAALAEALAPEPVPPNPDDLTRLHQALAIRTNGHGAFSEASAPVPTVRRFALPSWTVQVRRLRHPVAVLAVVGVLATGGVATAAVATNTLPGPSRDVAFDLGLPVSSPDLVATQACIGALRTALDSRDAAEVSTEANSLRRDLAALSPTELRQVVLEANQLLAQSSDFLDAAAAAARGGSGTAADQAHASGSAPAQPETAPSSQSLEGGSSGSGGDDGSAGSTSVSGGSDDSGGSSDGGTSVSGGNDDGGGSGTDGGTSVSGGGSGSGTDGGTAVLGGGSGSGTDGGTSVSGGGSGSGTDGGTSVSGGGSGSDGSSDGGTSVSGG